MSIRRKILLYFSSVVILLSGIAFFFLYTLFAEYREEEFQQRLKDKISTTLKLLTNVQAIDEDIIQTLDVVTVHNIYDEKLLIFNRDKQLIYSSIDDTPIPFSKQILSRLNKKSSWIETKDELYDVVGIYIEHKGKAYYGICKAYDISGYSKLRFLKYILLFTFIGISGIMYFISFFLSKKITRSIAEMTSQIKNYNFDSNNQPLLVSNPDDEILVLVKRFNELMDRLKKAFSFQKHAIHHISHELKTPIAILVSNFEKIETEKNIDTIQSMVRVQKEGVKNLGDIINSLLEIAKIEAGENISRSRIRMDELIFDAAAEIGILTPGFSFSIKYEEIGEEESFIIHGNERLLKVAVFNLMINATNYSDAPISIIKLTPHENMLEINFINNGTIIDTEDQQYLFRHFFRGANSKQKPGFGLGLVLVDRIVSLHGGNVGYSSELPDTNIFTITLPLS